MDRTLADTFSGRGNLLHLINEDQDLLELIDHGERVMQHLRQLTRLRSQSGRKDFYEGPGEARGHRPGKGRLARPGGPEKNDGVGRLDPVGRGALGIAEWHHDTFVDDVLLLVHPGQSTP